MIRVVVVDDHAVVRAGLGRLLDTADDIDVIATAADGREALARWPMSSSPTWCLMDLSMPGWTGSRQRGSWRRSTPGCRSSSSRPSPTTAGSWKRSTPARSATC